MAPKPTPHAPLQTLHGKVPREVFEAFRDLHSSVGQLRDKLAAAETAVATPPTTVTPAQLTQIQQALSTQGTHPLYASDAMARIPSKDPHVLGALWNNNGTFQASQG